MVIEDSVVLVIFTYNYNIYKYFEWAFIFEVLFCSF